MQIEASLKGAKKRLKIDVMKAIEIVSFYS